MRGLMAAAVLGLGLGSSSSSALAQALAWQVTEVSGAVTIRHGSGERTATRGATLAPGDVIATGAGGRAVMVHEKDFVTLAARSRATVPGVEQQASGFTKLLQDLGNAVYKIEKRGVPHFGVTTPYLAAVVKGTTFSITVDDRGSTLQVVEGAVEVATPDGGARDLILPAGVATIAAATPYRLMVHGDHERVIDSPGHGVSGPAAAPANSAVAPSSAKTTTAEPELQPALGSVPTTPVVAVAAPVAVAPAVATPAPVADVIAVPVVSRPVNMAAFTGGLVSGTGGYTALTAVVTQTAKVEATPAVDASHISSTIAPPAAIAGPEAPGTTTTNLAANNPAPAGAATVPPQTSSTSTPAVAAVAQPVNGAALASTAGSTTVGTVTVPPQTSSTSTPVVAAVAQPVNGAALASTAGSTTVGAVTVPPQTSSTSTPAVAAVAQPVNGAALASTAGSTTVGAVTPITTAATGLPAGDDGATTDRGNDLADMGDGSNKAAADAKKAAKDAEKAANQAAKDAKGADKPDDGPKAPDPKDGPKTPDPKQDAPKAPDPVKDAKAPQPLAAAATTPAPPNAAAIAPAAPQSAVAAATPPAKPGPDAPQPPAVAVIQSVGTPVTTAAAAVVTPVLTTPVATPPAAVLGKDGDKDVADTPDPLSKIKGKVKP